MSSVTGPEGLGPAGPDIFAGGGEMGDRMRALDWSRTPLGPVGAWPQNLKTCIRIILTSRQPMFVWWGAALINLYNDAYKAIVGGKHPAALGRPASEVWKEIWDQVGPRAAATMAGHEGTYDEALRLIMERHGYREETYYTFSYSPVPDDRGGAGGILCANTDDTQRIIGGRRMALLRELAARTTGARDWREALARAAEALATEPRDLPFARLYAVEADGGSASLVAATGITPGSAPAPARLDLGADGPWPAGAAHRSGAPVRAPAPAGLPAGDWDIPPSEVVALPVAPAGRTGRAGILVAGLNPYRPFDGDYRSFLELAAGQIASSLATAQAYEEERKRAEALAELDKAKTAFFSNISHEFRTPLTLMLGPLEDGLADAAHPLDPAQRERQELVRRNGLRLLRLVNDLLDFSRIEAGRAQAHYEPTDLGAYTAELASVFRSAMEQAGLAFTVDCRPLPGPVRVDRAMWEKIVLNLLSNALKFTLAGGVSLVLERAGDAVELRVRDTGVGIPAGELPRIFTRFHRVQGSGARTHEGSGIGLALVQELSRLHGGDVRVESEAGRGTTFTVSLPLAGAGQAGESQGSATQITVKSPGAAAHVEEALRWLPGGGADGSRGAGSAADPGLPGHGPGPDAPRILLADDNRDMREYVERILAAQWHVISVSNGAEALAAARSGPPDLVLSDVMMPGMDGFQLLKALRADPATAAVPVILLSARAGEEATVEGMEAGADDYLVKPFTARELLARVGARLEIDRLRRQQARSEREHAARLRASEALNRTIIANSPDCIKVLDGEGRLLSMNQGGMALLGIGDLSPFLGNDYVSWWKEPHALDASRALREARAGRQGRFQGEFPAPGDGSPRWWDVIVTPLTDAEGRPERFLVVSRDITAIREAEREADRFRSLVERSGDFIGIGDAAGDPVYINAAGLRMVGLGPDQDLRGVKAVDFYFPEDLPAMQAIGEVFVREGRWEGETRLRHFGTGAAIPVWLNVFALEDPATGLPSGIATVTRDLTQLKQTEEHLRQAQKMEAIGKLAGGIAHDFNNLLTAINGYASLALALPDLDAALREFLEEIRKSGQRAADLTGQLLAYSRKQVLAPKIIDLNAILADMDNMLRRLIGEDIELGGGRAPDLRAVKADPGQVQQIILNLALNARDAMPEGGRLDLETANVGLDAAFAAAHPGLVPGPHVLLSVRDTGVGMAPEVKARIFEPFFTTKEVGKGTGLGLSSAYGIVKQSGGAIAVDSEPGRGTTIRIYFPSAGRVSPAGAGRGGDESAGAAAAGTVLLVEDDAPVRTLVRRVLEGRGYRILEAPDGEEALRLARSHQGPIHLLLADMVMPRLGGPKLAERFRASRPEAKILLMSGYTDREEAAGEGDRAVHYIQKPFPPERLVGKVREMLEGMRV